MAHTPIKRLTRQQSKAKTQELLLKAAAKAFANQGFGGAAVDSITEAAGFSRGAFYSNFKSKDDLFLALVECKLKALTQEALSIVPSSCHSPEEAYTALKACYARFGETDRESALLFTEAQMYAVRNARFRSRLGRIFREVHESLRASLQVLQEQLGGYDPVSPELLALVSMSLGYGLALQNLMDPKHYSNDVISLALGTVFDRLMGTPHPK